MFRRAYRIAAFAALLVALPSAVPTADADPESRTLRFAADRDYPPYSFADASGEATGFDVDLLRAAADRVGLKIAVHPMDWADAVHALRDGDSDGLLGLARTDEREAFAAFASPSLLISYVPFVRKGDRPRSAEDLRGRPLLLQRGDVALDVLGGWNLEGPVLLTKTQGESLQRLAAREAFAAIAPRLTGEFQLRRSRLRNVEAAPVTLFVIEYGFAVRPNDARTLGLLNEGLSLVRREGDYARVYERWFSHLGPQPWYRRTSTHRTAGAGALALAGMLAGSVAGLRRIVRKRTAALEDRIAEREEAETRLRESEQRFHQLFTEMPDGCALHEVLRDANGKAFDYAFLMVNPAFERLTGLNAAQLTGRPVTEVLPDTEPHWIQTYGRVAETGRPVRFQEFSGALGRYYDVHAYCPEPGRFAVIFTDVTDRREAEQERRRLETQMLQAQKLESLGVLAGGIAHDFNNLLMAVLGNADLALAALPSAGDAREHVRDIELAARRAADLCRQLLAYSGRGRFVIGPVDLQRMVEDMARILSVSISKKAVLKYNFADNVPPVEGDASQLQQIVMNLIVNASEAIGERSGVVSLSLGAMDCDAAYLEETFVNESLIPGLYAYIEVSDTGAGMDAETLRRIFDPFFTTKFTGRGLGLAAVLGIVRGHKGAIKVYSEPGRGTTFKVLLPGAGQRGSEVEIPEPDLRLAIPPQHRSKAILLVDDEDTVRDVGRKMIEHVGLSVLTARDGREALQVFREDPERILCVILDLTMPHMDGEEAFRQIRRTNARVPVILSSGYSEQEVLDRFAGKGLAAFLKKPYRTVDLLATLGSVLGPMADEQG